MIGFVVEVHMHSPPVCLYRKLWMSACTVVYVPSCGLRGVCHSGVCCLGRACRALHMAGRMLISVHTDCQLWMRTACGSSALFEGSALYEVTHWPYGPYASALCAVTAKASQGVRRASGTRCRLWKALANSSLRSLCWHWTATAARGCKSNVGRLLTVNTCPAQTAAEHQDEQDVAAPSGTLHNLYNSKRASTRSQLRSTCCSAVTVQRADCLAMILGEWCNQLYSTQTKPHKEHWHWW